MPLVALWLFTALLSVPVLWLSALLALALPLWLSALLAQRRAPVLTPTC